MASEDRNFDDIADKLTRRIYGSLKGEIRLAVLARDLLPLVDAAGRERPLEILDAGGGVGQFGATLAARGHRIIHCDISARMLEKARAHYAAQAPAAEVRFIHGPMQSLGAYELPPFDLILCHAVVEWLADPRETLAALTGRLRPGGLMSTLFYNRYSLMMLYLLRGRFDKLTSERIAGWGNSLTPTNPQAPETVFGWFDDWGFETVCRSGVRCFHDYVPARRREEWSREEIVAAELKVSRIEAFRSTARYIHLLSRKPSTENG